MRSMISFLLVCFLISASYAQYDAGHIPIANRQEWEKAGLMDKNGLKTASNIINFATDSSAAVGENDDKIAAILEKLSGDKLTIIYFPEGEYTFYRAIEVTRDNVVLQGAGSGRTVLNFANEKTDPCISVVGTYFSTTYDIEGPVYKGTRIITPVSNNSSVKNKWIQFYDPQDGYGQITQVVDIGQTPTLAKTKKMKLIIKDKTTKTYKNSLLQIAPFIPRQNVGIENLKIDKITEGKGDGGSSIYFRRAVNCWVKGVESVNTSEHHIRLNYCSHIEISGNYLHHSQYYGEGGFGYGVNIQNNSTNNLVENNIFKHLRHSIALQRGANCNVVTYNYSYDRRSFNDDIFSPENESCDLVLHGNYPWGNLFEQNNVAAIAADNTHGDNGPYNVFIRNIARADGIIALQPGWYPLEYGLVIYKAPNTSLLGNVIKNNDIEYNASDLAVNIFGREAAAGAYDDWLNIRHIGSTYHQAKNDPNSYFLYDQSYFYSARPTFLPDNYTYPSIGPKPQSGIALTQDIPASGRVREDSLRTVNLNPTVYPLNITIITNTDESIDTTYINQLNLQPIPVADTLIHPQSGEMYIFAGLQGKDKANFDKDRFEIIPDFFTENIYSVFYKKSQRSSNAKAFANSNQRKVVRDKEGTLYTIYRSMGQIFLESRTDPEEWQFVSDNENSLYLDARNSGSVAMDYAKQDENYKNLVAFCYQQGNDIQVRTLIKENGRIVFGPQQLSIKTSVQGSKDVNPNIAWAGQGAFIVLWQDYYGDPGINYGLFRWADSLIGIDTGILTGSNDSSAYPAVSAWHDKATKRNHFDIVWQQIIDSTANSLRYIRLSCNPDNSVQTGETATVSKTFFINNSNASVVSLPQGALVCWSVDYSSHNDTIRSATVLRNATTLGDFYIYDQKSAATTINKYNDNSGYYFGWSSRDSVEWKNVFVTSDNLGWVRSEITTCGNEFQITNSNSQEDIALLAYYHDTSPYYYRSQNIKIAIEKPPVIVIRAKGFNFAQKTTDFDYLVSNLSIDGKKSGFISSSPYDNMFYSDFFRLASGSIINYDQDYGLLYRKDIKRFFDGEEFLSVIIDLVDKNERIYDIIQHIHLRDNNLDTYRQETFRYQNLKVTENDLRIRITFLTNAEDMSASRMNYYHLEGAQAFREASEYRIQDFELSQNYPNPFNPVTTISYQLPRKLRVIIKIFDLTGREVAVPVNEIKDQGRYSFDLDGSALASGMYICTMQAGSFTNSTKMLLIK